MRQILHALPLPDCKGGCFLRKFFLCYGMGTQLAKVYLQKLESFQLSDVEENISTSLQVVKLGTAVDKISFSL
jgi:hypothetical protein